ncbi:hypothetical protein [Paracoccus versutus]|uniref:hypothetical protein n=1 Tax=Paracoccus versutus TaxID=34007 RepID=UPI00215D9EC5|nr:hypothetical protein [Paracoccus versutus]
MFPFLRPRLTGFSLSREIGKRPHAKKTHRRPHLGHCRQRPDPSLAAGGKIP